jgi:hypothetical protein
MLLVSDVRPHYLFVEPYRRYELTSRREHLPNEFLCLPPNFRAMVIALLPFMYPTTFDTAYFGGILMQSQRPSYRSNLGESPGRAGGLPR